MNFELFMDFLAYFLAVAFQYRIFLQIRPPFSQFWGLPKCRGVLYAEYIHVYTFYKIRVPKSKGGLICRGLIYRKIRYTPFEGRFDPEMCELTRVKPLRLWKRVRTETRL